MSAPFADLELARRLEALVADEMRRFVTTAETIGPGCGAAALDVAGGVAAFVTPGSPVNQAVGLGFGDPVTEDHIAQVERFFSERGAQPAMAVCPLAHPTLPEALATRGWVLESFENVLVRSLGDPVEPPVGRPGDPTVTVIEAEGEEERDIWAIVAATGFSAPLDPSREQLVLCALVAARPGTRLFLALVDGRPAGTGELFVQDGVAWLSADSTLPQFRGRGVQTALQAHRLAAGREAGCAIAVSEAAPGGSSQRNMQRHGFQIAYTRANLVAAPGVRDDAGCGGPGAAAGGDQDGI